MEQIILNCDASEFDGFDRTQGYFSHRARILKDDTRRTVKQCVQAMNLDFSPSQWNQKLNETNNTSVSLNDADEYTEKHNDVGWIYFAVHKHIIKKRQNREYLLKLREDIDKQLGESNES